MMNTAIFSWPVRIYYEDTDAGGVVYHANYLRYMERARNEWLRTLGRPVGDINKLDGCLFVVASLDLQYKTPARLDDELAVTAELVQLKRVSMTLKQQVLRNDELIAVANINLVTVSTETFRPVAIPQSLATHPLIAPYKFGINPA